MRRFLFLLCATVAVVARGEDAPPPPTEMDAPVPPPMTEKEQKQHAKDIKEWELKQYDEVEKGPKRCDAYCENPCCQFATGHDTIEECGECDDTKKCAPAKESYGRKWVQCHDATEL